ncbi:hypothetical protein FCM35_KLT15645 [Carex littledalei]|uniref:DUF7787 domain-containing protein n=1 Tax=Carex littledalei TaxID=544730 RepID=A0A833RVN9_9POAL|nr:hypothetical protein FCM35_KLT15645 [Carex littledalei]
MKFEDYLSFFGNRHAHNLTTNQLNQILFLHGFRKLTNRSYIGLTKEEIIVALSSLNLIPPIRFGMSDCDILSVTTSMSAVSLEEVKHDMREIGWEECLVGSVLTINPAAAAVADNSTSIPTSQKKRRGKANRSRNDERSGLQSSVAEEGANKDIVKEV